MRELSVRRFDGHGAGFANFANYAAADAFAAQLAEVVTALDWTGIDFDR